VLGNTFDDGLYDIKLVIGPISARRMNFFLKPSLGDTILNMLCDLFFSGNVFIVREFRLIPEDANFVLSTKDQTTYLGLNTFI